MTTVELFTEPGHDVEREAMFFAVLRERARPTLASSEDDVRRRLQQADEVISEWLDEAEEEGAHILERARAQAAQIVADARREHEDALRSDVLALHGQLVQAIEQAHALLPALAATGELVAPAPLPPRGPLRRLFRRG